MRVAVGHLRIVTVLFGVLGLLGLANSARELAQASDTSCIPSVPNCTACKILNGLSVCAACRPPLILSRDTPTCDCPPGQVPGGPTGCRPCGAGKYCIQGQELNCPPNTVSKGDAQSLLDCEVLPGFYRLGGDDPVKPCPLGTYRPGEGSSLFPVTGCISCNPGVTTPDIGSISADACSILLPGYYLAGRYTTTSGISAALKCPVGTYSQQRSYAAADAPSCTPCSGGDPAAADGCEGTSCKTVQTKDVGATDATLCLVPPHFYYDASANIIRPCLSPWVTHYARSDWAPTSTAWSCQVTPCGQGRYSTGPMSCAECPRNRYTAPGGALAKRGCLVRPGYGIPGTGGNPEDLDAALCEPGTFSKGGTVDAACVQCPGNSWTEGWGASACSVCAPGYGTDDVERYINSSTSIDSCPQCWWGKRVLVPQVPVPNPAFYASERYQTTKCTRCPMPAYNFTFDGQPDIIPAPVTQQGIAATGPKSCLLSFFQAPENELYLPPGSEYENVTSFDACLRSCLLMDTCAAMRFDVGGLSASESACFLYTPNNDPEIDRYVIAVKAWTVDPAVGEILSSGSYSFWSDTTDSIGVLLGEPLELAAVGGLEGCQRACDEDGLCILITVDQADPIKTCTMRKGTDTPGGVRAGSVVKFHRLNQTPPDL